MMPGGRPIELTPEITKQICDLLKLGNTRRVAAEAVGVTERTLYRWIKRGEEELAAGGEDDSEFCQFCQCLTRAEAECQARNVAAIEKAAFGYKTQTTRTKIKRYEEFILGDDGKPIRNKKGHPLKRTVEETETVITDGQEFAYQAAIELLKRRFRTEWGDTSKLEHTGANGGPIQSIGVAVNAETLTEADRQLAEWREQMKASIPDG